MEWLGVLCFSLEGIKPPVFCRNLVSFGWWFKLIKPLEWKMVVGESTYENMWTISDVFLLDESRQLISYPTTVIEMVPTVERVFGHQQLSLMISLKNIRMFSLCTCALKRGIVSWCWLLLSSVQLLSLVFQIPVHKVFWVRFLRFKYLLTRCLEA